MKLFTLVPVPNSDQFEVQHEGPNGKSFAVRGDERACKRLFDQITESLHDAFVDFAGKKSKPKHER